MSNTIELSGIFSEGYGFVPKKLMKAKDIKSNTKLILCYLLSYTGAGTECFPSMHGISENLNMSKRTIIRCIQEAIIKGYLKKTQGELLDKRSNKYYLNFMNDFGDKKSPFLNKQSDKKSPNKKVGDNSAQQGAKKTLNKVTPGNSNNNMNSINKSNNNIYIQEIFDYWNSFNIICHESIDKFKSKIKLSLKSYSLKEIKISILNYNTILKDDKYYWSYYWQLDEFLKRGLERFMDFNICSKNFLNKKQLKGNDKAINDYYNSLSEDQK